MLHITVAQLDWFVGDIEGNTRKMIESAHRAALDGADLVVFSELCLTGYYPGDLLDEPGFLVRVAAGLDELRAASRQLPGLHWVVGAPVRRQGPGKKLHNALLVIAGGEVVTQYAKQLLPTYDVFDEQRHFAPGPDVARVLRIGNNQVGLMICEDGWNDEGATTSSTRSRGWATRRPTSSSPSTRARRTWASASSATRCSARRARATACRCCT